MLLLTHTGEPAGGGGHLTSAEEKKRRDITEFDDQTQSAKAKHDSFIAGRQLGRINSFPSTSK